MHIYMITGLTDIDISGHQSLKNTIKYLSGFGYKISVFSFFPKDYPNLQNPKEAFSSNVEFHRLPAGLSCILYFGKKIKDSIGMIKRKKKVNFNQRVDYYEQYNFIGRISHIVFLFIFYLPVELLRVSFYFLKEKPDIFYGVNWYGNIVSSLLGRIFKKPIITRFYGTSLQEQDLVKLKTKILHCHEILGLKIFSNAIIATNDGTKGDKILKLLGVDKNKIHFWMNGLDVDDLILPRNWDPNKFKETLGLKDKKIILMVSRLAVWKRADRGIHSIYRLVKEHQMPEVVLLIAGEGPDRKRLEELSESLKIKGSIRFLGGVPHNQIAKYFSIGDIFLSLYELSNLGNPVLEALYFGLPVVTIDDGSTSILLKNDYNAYLIKNKNLEKSLPLTVKMLLNDSPLRERIGQNALATFESKILSWEDRIKLEHELIQKLFKKENKQNG